MSHKPTADEKKQILEAFVLRHERRKRADLASTLFGPQRAFIEDPSKRKVATCSRRSGKTYGIATNMVITAHQYDFCQVPYVTLTRAQAKRNIWQDLQVLNAKHELGARFNHNELTCTFPNGSVIFLSGANDATEIERLRGGKYPLACVDEAQSFRSFVRVLIDDILDPATSDYDGTIVVTGTPGIACAGFFYEASNGVGEQAGQWSRHHWTVLENPHHKKYGGRPEAIEAKRTQMGWAPDNPTFLREYKGQWVKDDSKLVYKLDSSNYVYTLPELPLTYVLGMDLGFEDATAFAVIGYNESVGKAWVIESHAESGLIPAAVAAKVHQYMERFDIAQVVADAGGFGKGYVEELKQRYGVPIIPAEKTRKLAYIELLNGDLQAGNLLLMRNQNRKLIDEMGTLPYLEDEDGKSVDRSKIDDRFSDHLCDALLYGWRYCHQFLYDPELEDLTPGTPEWYRREEAAMEEEVAQRLLGGSKNPWWSQGYQDTPFTSDGVLEALEGQEWPSVEDALRNLP